MAEVSADEVALPTSGAGPAPPTTTTKSAGGNGDAAAIDVPQLPAPSKRKSVEFERGSKTSSLASLSETAALSEADASVGAGGLASLQVASGASACSGDSLEGRDRSRRPSARTVLMTDISMLEDRQWTSMDNILAGKSQKSRRIPTDE